MRNAVRQPMTRPVWLVLISWGVAVLVISGLLSWRIWRNEHEAAQQAARAQAQAAQVAAEAKLRQDQAMCAMLDLLTTGPEPVKGPAGDRGRVILKAMIDYRATLQCPAASPPR